MLYILMMIHFFIMKILIKLTFTANQRHILAVDLDKNNLENDNNFFEHHTVTIIYVSLWLGVITLKNMKHLRRR